MHPDPQLCAGSLAEGIRSNGHRPRAVIERRRENRLTERLPIRIIGSLSFVTQVLDGYAVDLLEEFRDDRFELFQDWWNFVELCLAASSSNLAA